jgi:hypothetical protein
MTFPDYSIIVKEVNKILTRFPDTKLTLRQIYYQLVAAMIIENNEKSYKNLSRALVKARENGAVDDSRMEDRGRQTIGGDRYPVDPKTFYQEYEDAFRECWRQYSRPMWQGQNKYCEVWIEKDALSRIVSDVARGYGVITCIAKGYSSYTFINNAAARICKTCYPAHIDIEDSRAPVILYFGDFDPSGEDMVRDLGARLEKYGVPGGEEIVEKIALNRKQIDKYSLPSAPTKEKDVRAKKFIAMHGDEVVELDALNPDILKELVKDSILANIDASIWNNNRVEARKEQEVIREQVEAHFARE